MEVVVKGVEAPSRGPLGRGPQSSLQVAYFLARRRAAGVVRSALGGHSLARACADDTATPGTLPYRGVVPHRDRRYYDPLGLPLRTPRLRLRLIRARSPRPRPRRRVSRVPRVSLHTCCAPYPAGTVRRLRIPRVRHRLRRDMSGSAPGLFICRGCRLHFMLRPVCSLPAARLAPPRGLLTPRSGGGVSPTHLGPATRRSGAYRGGTLTRWTRAACRLRTGLPVFVCFTTHHGPMISERAQALAAARLPSSSSTHRRSTSPTARKKTTTEMPIRCEPNRSASTLSRKGPMKAVALPEKAKKP